MTHIEKTLQEKFASHMWPNTNNIAKPEWFSEYAKWVYDDALDLLHEQQRKINSLETTLLELEMLEDVIKNPNL